MLTIKDLTKFIEDFTTRKESALDEAIWYESCINRTTPEKRAYYIAKTAKYFNIALKCEALVIIYQDMLLKQGA